MSSSIDLTGYDIVMAVTQDAVNTAIGYSPIWAMTINYNMTANPPPPNPTPNPMPPQSQCDGLFGATLAPPVVSLTLPNGAKNTNQVAVTLTFKGGNLQTFNTYSRSEQTTNVTGWTIQFNVDLALAPVVGGDLSKYPPAVQAALSNPNLSVTQLCFDFINIDWTDAIFADQNGTSVTDITFTSALQQSLRGWLNGLGATVTQAVLSWLQAAKSGGGQAPAYAPPNSIAAFVPTSYSYSVTPYNPAGSNDGLGTINYLMMTQNRLLPSASNAGIFNNNWVPAPNTQEYQGTLCMDNALFNSGFVMGCLVPSIAQLVCGKSAAFAGVQPVITQINDNEWTISQYAAPYADQYDGKGERIHHVAHTISVYENITEQVSCTVQLDPQSNPPVYTVNGAFNGDLTMTEVAAGVTMAYSSLFAQTWSFTITLAAGSNGTIQATASTIDVPTSGYSHKTKGDDFLGQVAAGLSAMLSNIMETFASQFQKDAQEIAKANTDSIGANLGGAMTALSTSVIFPGSRNYAFKNLSFSPDAEENLVTNITFKD